MNIHEHLEAEFPWLKNLGLIANSIVETLWKKEADYQGSWQKRGGPGAFMMLARKWDRIENISKEDNFDIFKSVKKNRGEITDDIDDLIGYLLLVRSKVQTDNAAATVDFSQAQIHDPTDLSNLAGTLPESFGYVDQDRPSPAHPKHKPLSGGNDG